MSDELIYFEGFASKIMISDMRSSPHPSMPDSRVPAARFYMIRVAGDDLESVPRAPYGKFKKSFYNLRVKSFSNNQLEVGYRSSQVSSKITDQNSSLWAATASVLA